MTIRDPLGSPVDSHEFSQQLATIVGLTEGIKGVVAIASQINVMALNAIVLSQRAGEIAQGFGVISKELRALSMELTSLMNALSADAFTVVNLVSDQLRRERRYQLLRAAQLVLPDPSAPLNRVLAEQQTRFQSCTQEVHERRLCLLDRLEEARKLCRFGTAISRSAKIEAAFGQGFRSALGGVSQDFDKTIQTILPSIEALIDKVEHI
ncbi:MAG TPA: methyl-accepting chemotaxis protein [Vulgatibacter sp.]|nr:methyl-accepting chemotaxis protein [Vulgatibacter sp.]